MQQPEKHHPINCWTVAAAYVDNYSTTNVNNIAYTLIYNNWYTNDIFAMRY